MIVLVNWDAPFPLDEPGDDHHGYSVIVLHIFVILHLKCEVVDWV